MTPFEALLEQARARNSTSLADAGTGIRASIRPEPDEIVVACPLDTPEARQILELQSAKLCDGLVHYRRTDAPPTVLLLVELKGNRVAYAVEQLCATYRVLRPMVREVVDCRAAIVTVGSGLPRTKELQRSMPPEGRRLDVLRARKGAAADLGGCLRRG